MSEPTVGDSACARLVVEQADLASAVGVGSADTFPAVFATARMVALMEIAAGRLLRPHLAVGEMSVGVSVDVGHIAPTPPGATVVATARYLERDGKLFVFAVSAEDAGGEIGRGLHKRAIVTTERLEQGAARRVSGEAR